MPQPFDLDLNQLRVLDALLQEGSVTGAATRLRRPQSTVSTVLGRLRESLGDPLFTRTASGLVPTARALDLKEPLHRLLGELGEALEPPLDFDPGTSTRTFTLAASDYTQFVLAGRLMEEVALEAPLVRLGIQALGSAPPWSLLGEGRLDLLLGGRVKAPEGLRSRMLFQDTVVCLVRARHPVLREPWDLARYQSLEHVEVASGLGPTLADQALAEQGLTRTVRLTVPHFLVAPFVALRTDLCFTLARRIADPLARLLPFRVLDLPFPAPKVAIRVFWHPRQQRDPGHRWLREVLGRAVP